MSPLSSTHCEYYHISARRTRHALQAETMGDGYVSAILKTAPVRDGIRLGVDVLSNRGKLGMDQVFVVWTSKSGLNQPTVV